MPPRRMHDLFEEPDTKYIHHQPPGPERANIRSATPMGFAKAVFQANSPEYIGDSSKSRDRSVYG